MISILSKLNVYGSHPESESDHCWVAIIDEATHNGFFALTACCKCGLLARKLNSNAWETSSPSSGQWDVHLEENCPGDLKEINH